MVVLDTSVIVKWFLPERGSDRALALRESHANGADRIVLPDFSPIELGNVLRYKFAGADQDIAAGAVRSVSSMGAQIVATSPDLVAIAIDAAYSSEISVYDALYVSLAREVGMDLITADLELYEKCKDKGRIHLLGE